MFEKRLTTRLIQQWNHLRDNNNIPIYERLNPSCLDEIWQNCLTLKVQPSVGRKIYQYTHVGREIAQAIGADIQGHVLSSNMKHFPGARIIKRIDELFAVNAPDPIEDDGQFVNESGKIVKYRACLLAFGNRDNAVTHILIGVSWRAF